MAGDVGRDVRASVGAGAVATYAGTAYVVGVASGAVGVRGVLTRGRVCVGDSVVACAAIKVTVGAAPGVYCCRGARRVVPGCGS